MADGCRKTIRRHGRISLRLEGGPRSAVQRKFTETLVRADGSMYDVQAGYIQENIPTEELKRAYDADNVVYFFFFNTPYEGTPVPGRWDG